ncbi:MAG: hypothetical protein QUV05_20600 [Phycisphaerae bacterium]|nr:hypothetical protein [Phycisphaerae bacterium]
MRGQGTATVTPNRCMICGETNATQTSQCLACAAPMALLHDSIAQDREPQIVSIIGDTNVGKTVYLGFLLDMLTHRAGDFEAIPKGAYSIDLQQTVISNMARRLFPPKTPMEANQWYWAYYQVYQRASQAKWVDLIMPDIAGESLAAEVAAPNTFKVIRNLLNKSAGLMLLTDAALAASGSSQPDFFAVRMLSYIDTMYGTGRNQRINTPTAILLCKADQCPDCFDDPTKFVKANMNRLWNLCESRLSNFAFFACSVVGSLGYATAPQEDYVIPVPLHTALQGVLEPFQWVVDQL